MSALQKIQSDFQSYVLAPRTGQPAIAAAIADQFGLSADDRLAIYHNAYRLRICEALSSAYDKTHAYLGDQLFEECCLGYIDRHPSRFSNMRWYGDRFAAYLADVLSDHPIVSELATFEWSLSLAFDAEDAPVLTAQDLGAITPEQWADIGFDLQPSVQFITMQTNAVASWLALDRQQPPPDAEAGEPVTWLIWRKELQPHFRSLDPLEAQALQRLAAGASFAQMCEEIADSSEDPDVMNRIAVWLQTWMVEQLLATARAVAMED